MLSRKPHLIIETQDTLVKVTALDKRNTRAIMTHEARFDSHWGEAEWFDAFEEEMRRFTRARKLEGCTATVTIPSENCILRKISLPDGASPAAARYEVERTVELPAEEFSGNIFEAGHPYSKVRVKKGDREVFFAGARAADLERMTRAVNAAGLKLKAIVPDVFAWPDLCSGVIPDPAVFLHIKQGTAALALFDSGKLRQCRSFSIPGPETHGNLRFEMLKRNLSVSLSSHEMRAGILVFKCSQGEEQEVRRLARDLGLRPEAVPADVTAGVLSRELFAPNIMNGCGSPNRKNPLLAALLLAAAIAGTHAVQKGVELRFENKKLGELKRGTEVIFRRFFGPGAVMAKPSLQLARKIKVDLREGGDADAAAFYERVPGASCMLRELGSLAGGGLKFSLIRFLPGKGRVVLEGTAGRKEFLRFTGELGGLWWVRKVNIIKQQEIDNGAGFKVEVDTGYAEE